MLASLIHITECIYSTAMQMCANENRKVDIICIIYILNYMFHYITAYSKYKIENEKLYT